MVLYNTSANIKERLSIKLQCSCNICCYDFCKQREVSCPYETTWSFPWKTWTLWLISVTSHGFFRPYEKRLGESALPTEGLQGGTGSWCRFTFYLFPTNAAAHKKGEEENLVILPLLELTPHRTDSSSRLANYLYNCMGGKNTLETSLCWLSSIKRSWQPLLWKALTPPLCSMPLML